MKLERIGPYTIQGVLGRGGMGTVYRAQHLDTGEVDAVKVLAPNFADNEHFRGRFESEIQALLKLNHPNIVKLLSYGQEDGMLFFSMELVDGNSLFDMQKKGHKFDWREVLKIAQDCALGLRHAHDRGVIHRDLKPGNLLMAYNDDGLADHVKLTDFGIAKRFGSSQNTGTNILGTMDFMSPEQAKGEPVTQRSDLYSLGTVMFTLLSGRPPFTSNSVEESLRNLTRVPAPRISTLKPDVPRPLDDLISRLMAKRPEERVPTALALTHQLSEIEEGLREYSEAKTAEGTDGSKLTLSDPKTIDTVSPKTVVDTEAGESRGETGLFRTIKPKQQDADATAVLTDDPLTLAPEEPKTGVDFYKPVTDQVRGKSVVAEAEPANESKGALWLALALVAVLALGAYGVVVALRPPTAEQLFTVIDGKADEPQRVLEEMEQFLSLYPDEPRAADVASLQKVGKAIREFQTVTNTLTVRANSPTGLSNVEKQFMDIVDLIEEQPDAARAKMSAFATIHESRDDLTKLERRCVAAASSYKIKRDHEVQSAVLFNLQQVREKFEFAQGLEDHRKAIEVYQSLIALYGDTKWGLLQNGSEGRNLIRQSRQEIRRRQQAIREDAKAKEQAERDDQAAAESTRGPEDQ